MNTQYEKTLDDKDAAANGVVKAHVSHALRADSSISVVFNPLSWIADKQETALRTEERTAYQAGLKAFIQDGKVFVGHVAKNVPDTHFQKPIEGNEYDYTYNTVEQKSGVLKRGTYKVVPISGRTLLQDNRVVDIQTLNARAQELIDANMPEAKARSFRARSIAL